MGKVRGCQFESGRRLQPLFRALRLQNSPLDRKRGNLGQIKEIFLPRSIGFRFALLGGSNLAVAGLGFISTIYIARVFGAEGLGKSTLALSIAGFAVMTTLFGTQHYSVRTAIRRPMQLGVQLRTVTRLRMVLALVSFCLLFLVSFTTPAFRDVATLILLFGVSVFPPVLNPEWLPQAMHRADVTAAANFGTQALFVSFLFLAGSYNGGLWSIAAAKVAADLLVAIAVRRWSIRQLEHENVKVGRRDLWELARGSAPIWGTQILRTISLTSDLILVGIFATAIELGHYAAASKLFLVMMSLATAYFVISLPRFVEASMLPAPAFVRELSSSLRRTVPIAVLGLVALALLSKIILTVMFGEEYSDASASLIILGAATVASLIARHYGQVLITRNLQALDLRLNFLGSLVHVGSKVPLILFFGITGAAVGTLCGEVVTMLLQRRASYRLLDQPLADAK